MLTLQDEYNNIKKQILDHYFTRMNAMQREAVFTVEGPVLILAGAGSGKTTVLINRILNMVRFGNAYRETSLPAFISPEDLAFLRSWLHGEETQEERLYQLLACHPVRPWNILAITFTNKAAGELRLRLAQSLGDMALDVQAATFHATCVRILRRNIERLGYGSDFTIYDTDDSIRVIKKQMDALKASDKNIKPRSILSAISRAKDRMLTPPQMLAEAGGNFPAQIAARAYEGYQQELRRANAVDFDDIILLCVRLLEEFPDVLTYYQQRFRYIMVDEYQDTNMLQYRLIYLLSAAHRNLCVVGDDDQSIYKFRGATIENILHFEEQFPGAQVVRLEQNYRSTKTILDAANAVIQHNTERRGKNLWTQNDAGVKLSVYRATDEQGEARYISKCIGQNVRAGGHFAEHAVLYRMNAQSNMVERELTRSAIPYKIVGGLRFYERKEIKDAVAYLSVLRNPGDTLRLTRILNEPKRGIGGATLAAALDTADREEMDLFEVFRRADQYPEIARKALSLLQFAALIDGLREDEQSGMPLDMIFERVLDKTGYLAALLAAGEAEQTRVENLEELKTNIQHYIQENETPTLTGFLEEIALYTDLDSYNDSDDRVILMTIHSAKGLEFNHVFLAGAEEGIFPGNQTFYAPEELQEERRLAYVALTRARETLHMTCCGQRMLFGKTSSNPISRFVREIPQDLYEMEDETLKRYTLSPAATAHTGNKRAAAQASAAVSAVASSAAAAPTSTSTPRFTPGERVEHPVYNAGTVLSVKAMGGDQLIEIAFDSVGTKKVMANYAKLKKT